MIALIQRVSEARVVVDGATVGAIGAGILALICAERGDGSVQVDALLAKVLKFRVFADADGRMNRSLQDVCGALLLVPQFTLAADTRSGTRPSFTPAAPPDIARQLFDDFVARARRLHQPVASGVFGADMKVSSTNDGPVTFWLRMAADGAGKIAPTPQED